MHSDPMSPTSSTTVHLPSNNATCVEMSAVRAASAACHGAAVRVFPDGPGVLCPRSLERTPCSAILRPPAQCDGVTELSGTLGWERVVFGVATYDSASEQVLLQAAADTWLRMVGGADLLVVTDRDDRRTDEQIAPRIGAPVATHVHRCTVCCGRAPCTGGVSEGWLARTKVRVLFSEAHARFGDTKDFIFKFDPDTVLAPHALQSLLSEVRLSHCVRPP